MLNEQEFFSEYPAIRKQYDGLGQPWSRFAELAAEYEQYRSSTLLNEIGWTIAQVMQTCPRVHSVRTRIKDTKHLIEKVIRKMHAELVARQTYDSLPETDRADADTPSAPYREITPETLPLVVSDLLGVRALHLYKHDWIDIDRHVQQRFQVAEGPTAHCRLGDPESIVRQYDTHGCKTHINDRGYRSIHYIIMAQLGRTPVRAELQVRTIFEEGWSEIDHQVNYPKPAENELLNRFLLTFNRVSGMADEIGTFVQGLCDLINAHAEQTARWATAESEARSQLEATLKLLNISESERQKLKLDLEGLTRALRGGTQATSQAVFAPATRDITALIEALGRSLGRTERSRTSSAIKDGHLGDIGRSKGSAWTIRADSPNQVPPAPDDPVIGPSGSSADKADMFDIHIRRDPKDKG